MPEEKERKKPKKHLKQRWMRISLNQRQTPNHKSRKLRDDQVRWMPGKLYTHMTFSKYKKSIIRKNKKQNPKRRQREKKHITYRGTKRRIISNFSSDTKQIRSNWREIFKVFWEKQQQWKPHICLEFSGLWNYTSKVKRTFFFFF